VCPCSPESQTYPGLHQKKRGQQVKGSAPAPLLCAGEASPGVLHPDVVLSTGATQTSWSVHPEEGHKNDPRDETPLLRGQA